ncbi:MAG: hypothetical protein ACOC41_05110 [Chitinivibrionales bacterium]
MENKRMGIVSLLAMVLLLSGSVYAQEEGAAEQEQSVGEDTAQQQQPVPQASEPSDVPTEEVEERVAEGDDGTITIGGALRYNFLVGYFEDDDLTANDIQWTWDTWRLNVSGQKQGFLFDFEYRFYPSFDIHFIHHGWAGYRWNNNTQLEVGVTQVPFGDLTYASHSYWFSTAYYVGLEDDYDMGIKLTHRWKSFDLALAYFLQAEPRGLASGGAVPAASRYSYDIVPGEAQSYEEKNQFNLRGAYVIDMGYFGNIEFGLSGQYGQIYNDNLGDDAWSNRYAGAVHLDATVGQINLKAHTILYNFDAQDAGGDDIEAITMGAYGDTYLVASQAALYTVGLAYTLPFDIGPATVTFYDDYTYMAKDNDDFENTQQNVFGASIAAGPIFTYVDLIAAYNHPWITDGRVPDLAAGAADPEWNYRFNINLGYYF